MGMKSKDVLLVNSAIENEGFWYCFTGYSAWKDIEDKEFHRLLDEMIDASDKLKEYIGCDE